MVFWTKNPQPFLKQLDELDQRGYRYYFLFTLNDYPRLLEPRVPPLERRIESFRLLSDRLGPERVIWRYDPIVISNLTDYDYHLHVFSALADRLEGYTLRVIISLVQYYRKTRRHLMDLAQAGLKVDFEAANRPATMDMLRELASCAASNGAIMQSCCDPRIPTELGIAPGRCIDGELIERLWPSGLTWPKDPGQRPACGCAKSKDIGAADTCGHGCVYCYSTVSDRAVTQRLQRHRPESPIMVGEPPAVTPQPLQHRLPW